MKTPSRGASLAIAALVAASASVAIAKGYERGWGRMSAETTQRLEDGRMAMAKTALKLTPDQEKLWAPVEEQVRAAFKDRADRRAERQKRREERQASREAKDDGKSAGGESLDRPRQNLADRFERMSTELTRRAERMKLFSGAFTPFYASLSDEQKDVLRPLIRDLAPGFAGRGKRHAGNWRDGDRGGWRDGWHGKRGDKDAPVIDGKAEAGAADEDKAPASDKD